MSDTNATPQAPASQPAPAPQVAPAAPAAVAPAQPQAPVSKHPPSSARGFQEGLQADLARIHAQRAQAQAPAAPEAPVAPQAQPQAAPAPERPRGPDGKFLPASAAAPAPAAPAAPPTAPNPGQPDAEPLIEIGGGFAPVAAKQVPRYVDAIVKHRTGELQTSVQDLTAKHQAAEKAAREANDLLNQLTEWAIQDPQGLHQTLRSSYLRGAPRPQSAQPTQSSLSAASQAQPPRAPLSQEDLEAWWSNKQAEQQKATQRAEFERNELQRLNTTLTDTLAPILAGASDREAQLIRRQVGAYLFASQEEASQLPEPLLIQRIAKHAQDVRNELREVIQSVAGQQQAAVPNPPPAIVGGNNLIPRAERIGNPLNRREVEQMFRTDLARLKGM